jgi:hypothetical protein
MFEADLLDEEIKKKKRRVLVGLILLFFGGSLVTLSVAQMFPPTPTAVPGALVETSTYTPTSAVPPPRDTATPAGVAQGTPAPQLTETAISASTASPVTETPGGTGGGALVTPTSSPTAVSTPTATTQASATATPVVPAELPVTGVGPTWGLGSLALGLVAILLGIRMLRAGYALGNAGR